MNFIIWNVRGTNNANFRCHCEAMVKMHKPVMLVLLETRMGNTNASLRFSISTPKFCQR
ncbi:hypothetical protein R3W88_008987 [Solanum pinnatisectum]|uniref:Uncharacterized protein n=1 Tax=Solanum pinnatisectum TaxID=50273 RepID=A0AAV9M9L5_9SOLN|nr:hypothetical protein R3W88_008987 [Solanum pinnatisectum]